jgi:hypothetical protein
MAALGRPISVAFRMTVAQDQQPTQFVVVDAEEEFMWDGP